MFVYYVVLFGGQVVIVDFKVKCGKWKEMLLEIVYEINIVNLISDDENKGLFDYYVILSCKKDFESLVIDILIFFIGIFSCDSDKFLQKNDNWKIIMEQFLCKYIFIILFN